MVLDCLTPKVKTSRSLGSTEYNIAEDLNRQEHGCENLKTYLTDFAKKHVFKCDFSPFRPQINTVL